MTNFTIKSLIVGAALLALLIGAYSLMEAI
jgi:hypothetical protein